MSALMFSLHTNKRTMDKNRNILWKMVIALTGLGLFLTACGSGKTIPTGTLDEVMKDQESFYTLRGGSDYGRLPLRYPFHIVDTIRRPDLCSGRHILIEDVAAINVQSNYVFGTFSGALVFGESRNAGWFAINVLTESNSVFESEIQLSRFLLEAGITNSALKDVKSSMKNFMFTGELAFPH
ncbi:MAG: hypothetical protein HOP33_11370 [Verrucomicrobia bacterium]|nr:hypothetical protein [Verrucomicrobiota bacterium]